MLRKETHYDRIILLDGYFQDGFLINHQIVATKLYNVPLCTFANAPTITRNHTQCVNVLQEPA